MNVRDLQRRHGAGRAARQLVHHVARARAAEHGVDGVARGLHDARDMLAAGQRLLLHVADAGHGAGDRRDLGRRKPGAHRAPARSAA